ncbi:hypothetical protein GCM10027578_18020 [Spirosoma luteolum]
MTFEALLRLFKQSLLWFILFPVITAGTAWFVTRDTLKTYRSDASLYTGLASGYTLLTDRLGQSMDRSASAFDNLLSTLYSKENRLQVGVSLLNDHLRLRQPDTLVLGAAGFDALHKAIPADWQPFLLNESDSVRLWTRLDSLSKTPGDNPVKELLLKSSLPYSINTQADKLKAEARKNTNDVLLMEYEANDPAVAQQTLRYTIDVLNRRNSFFKTSETNSVVTYYEDRLKKAKATLDAAEGRLRAFQVQHKVLDYDEEARTVASGRESLDQAYNQELMRRNAAKAAVDALARQMAQQGKLSTVTNDLNEKQRKLTQAESQLANAKAYGQPRSVLTRLQANVDQMSEDLKSSAQKYYSANNSPEAVPQQTMVNEWMQKTLEYEESSARLKSYEKQRGEYQVKTNAYSPLGSQLRQLNRDVEVAEKEYFALLQNVEQSRTRRQDVAVGGKLEVLDAPDYPLVPLSSKRMQLVGLGAGVGIFLALLLMAIRFWLDKRIQSPEQAERLIGRPVTALFPTVRKPQVYSKVTRASRAMFEQLLNAINIEIAQASGKPYPPIMTIFSVRAKQGKTWLANGLIDLYANADQQVAYCYPRASARDRRQDRPGVTYFPYTIRPDFMNVTGIDYLIDAEQSFDASQYDRIILELPSLMSHQIPVYLLKSSVLSVLVVDAQSAWGRAEKQLLSLYIRVTNQPLLTVLNRVDDNYVDVPGRADASEVSPRSERTLQPTRYER